MTIDELQEELDALRAYVEELEEAMGFSCGAPTAGPDLTSTCWRMLALLCRKPVVMTHEQLLAARPRGLGPVDSKLAQVQICKLRGKLVEAGFERSAVRTVWGEGYIVSAEDAVRLKAVWWPDDPPLKAD